MVTMSKKDLAYPIDKLISAIENLEDDREKQLEIYGELSEFLFGEKGKLKSGKRGLLDPEVIANLVNLMNNMTTTTKTLSEISKTLFESSLVYNDVSGSKDDSEKSDGEILDRTEALRLVNNIEEE